MARRISAFIGIVVLVGLVLALMWNVYEHREGSRVRDEPAIVSLTGAKG
ncbi:MAG: hypothetical protein ACXV5L_03800 [Thermoanaerobaculia bacterium]